MTDAVIGGFERVLEAGRKSMLCNEKTLSFNIVMLIASASFSTLARISTTTPSKAVRCICFGP